LESRELTSLVEDNDRPSEVWWSLRLSDLGPRELLDLLHRPKRRIDLHAADVRMVDVLAVVVGVDDHFEIEVALLGRCAIGDRAEDERPEIARICLKRLNALKGGLKPERCLGLHLLIQPRSERGGGTSRSNLRRARLEKWLICRETSWWNLLVSYSNSEAILRLGRELAA
jgi:hypothetical protein